MAEMDMKQNTEVEQTAEMEEKIEKSRIYISLPKAFCHQYESKIEGQEFFNVMLIPDGTMVDGTDMGGKEFHPLYMGQNTKNPNLMTATYYVNEAEGLEITVKDKEGNKEKVDVMRLKEAIQEHQKEYWAERRSEKENTKEEKESSPKKEKETEKEKPEKKSSSKGKGKKKEKDDDLDM